MNSDERLEFQKSLWSRSDDFLSFYRKQLSYSLENADNVERIEVIDMEFSRREKLRKRYE